MGEQQGTPQSPPEAPNKSSQPRALTSDQQDMADLQVGAGLLAAMKRGKGQPATKWEELSRTAGRLSGQQEQVKPKVIIPNFSSKDGHKLVPQEQVDYIKTSQPEIQIPNFSSTDAHKLTPEEQLDQLKKDYS